MQDIICEMVDRDYINERIREAMKYRSYELNLDKVNSIDDCKKILKFLCEKILEPTPEGIEYNGFDTVREYFNP